MQVYQTQAETDAAMMEALVPAVIAAGEAILEDPRRGP